MLIRYPAEPKGIIQAGVLHYREGVMVSPRHEQSLLPMWETDVEDRDVAERYQQLVKKERWGKELDNCKLTGMLFMALRCQKPPWQLMLNTVGELLNNGPRFVYTGAGDSSRKLLRSCRQVAREIHCLSGYVRLDVAADGVLVGKAPLTHNCGDLVALALARRNPGQPLALLTPTGNWFVANGSVAPLKGLDYSQVEDTELRQAWLAYYRTQFVAQRNNPRHAARAIPQRYWAWLAEGEELAEKKYTSGR